MSESTPGMSWLARRIPFYYGWIMLPVAMVILMATVPGQTFGVSTFNPYLLREFELSQSELSGAYMLGTLLASLPMIYIGVLMDRHGLRRVLAVVVILFGLACIGMSQTQGLVTVFFGFLFLRMFGQGAMSFLAASALPMWFNRRLGLVSGVMTLGESMTIALFPSLNLMLIHNLGWRTTYATLGIAVWVAVLPLLIFLFRNRPEAVGQFLDGARPISLDRIMARVGDDDGRGQFRDYRFGEALRTRAYWIVVVSSVLPAMIITGIAFHAVQIYVDQGMSESDAAAMFATFAVASSALMLLGGILADKVPPNLLLAVALGGLALGVLLVMDVTDGWKSTLFATVTGGALGLFSVVNATIWVRYYGRANLGKIRGGLTTVGVASSSVGPFILGLGYDHLGGYDVVFWALFGITLPMAGIALLATQPPQLPIEDSTEPLS